MKNAKLVAFAVFASLLATSADLSAQRALPTDLAPKIEVTFVLDTTSSMAGLIEGAKRKIWTIARQMVGGRPTPAIRLGLIGYRDRGDEYVTRTFDLTNDIDAIYGHLTELQAVGGGDIPESVNQA